MKISYFFDEVQDFRELGRCKHGLSDILGLILVGSLADCNDFSEIVDYGLDNIKALRQKLGFQFLNGIPSEDTLERVMRYINPKELEACYQACYKALSLNGKHVCIDGKELRGTIRSGKKKAEIQMVNLWVDDFGLSFGQEQVAKKSNEITAIPKLLEGVDCKGSIITIDAIACQKEIIEKIVSKKADYVIALKGNQKTLCEQVKAEFDRYGTHANSTTSINKEHGRGEHRKVAVIDDLRFIDDLNQWEGVESVIKLDSIRYLPNKKEEQSAVFYLSSIKHLTPELAAKYIRNHWRIENRLHRQATLWQLDFTFKEDDSKVRKDLAPANLHIVRKWSINILKKDSSNISMKRKRKKAARKIDYLIQILTAD
ncbi:MAG: ISAs1 family transposase [Bacteroidota bacterium]